ncbi:MAG: hypothetical protein HEQ40_04910 [Lacibacter sp.]|jgi:hypothetical protein
MNHKHYVIYYKQGTGTLIITEPRPWARENQHLFPDFNFINANPGNHPTTNQIEQFLINNYQFQIYENNIENITVLFNFNPALGL